MDTSQHSCLRELAEVRAVREHGLTLHPLFRRLADNRTPAAGRLAVLRPLAPLAMGFTDIARWVLPFPRPRGAAELAVAARAEENAAHASLYLYDWKVLGFDEVPGWDAAGTLSWTLRDPHTLPARRCLAQLARIPRTDHGDPVLRLLQCAVLQDACTVFCTHCAPLAQAHYPELLYAGRHHLERETTRTAAEQTVQDVPLTPWQTARGTLLVHRLFDRFEDLFTGLLTWLDGTNGSAGPPVTGGPAGWTSSWTLQRCYSDPAMAPLRRQHLSDLAGAALPLPPTPPEPEPSDPDTAQLARLYRVMTEHRL